MDNKDQILDGGIFTDKLKKKKIIFFNYKDVRDWSIFNYVDPFDHKPGKVNNKDKLQYTIAHLSATNFTKEDLYKQINQKAYSCFTNDTEVKLVDLTFVKLTNFFKRTDSKGGQSLAEAAFQNYRELNDNDKTIYLNQVVSDILDAKSKGQHNAYKEILSKLNAKGLAELLIDKCQTGGAIPNILDGFVPIEPSDVEPSFGFLLGGAPPKIIKLDDPVKDSEQSYRKTLQYLQQKKELSALSLNAILIVNESIVGKDYVEHIYF